MDRSALYGALSQMEMLGLDLVELTTSYPPDDCVGPDDRHRHDGRPTSR
jgi:hypothetical protein